MKRAAATLALCWIAGTTSVNAQNSPAGQSMLEPLGRVDTVFLSGNETTKDYVILDEMSLRPGSIVTRYDLEFDRRRIYSLGLFTRVDLMYDSLAGKRYVLVDVNERWYLFPVPIFGFRDGDPQRIYFGGGVVHNNVGGRNQKLFASLILGYDPSASVSFVDPLIDHENRLFFSTGASFARVKNKSVQSGDFQNLTYDLNGTLGKRFGLYHMVGLNLGYQIVQASSYEPGRTVSPSGRDAFLYTTASYTIDSRDIAEYAMEGSLASMYVGKVGFGTSEVNYLRYGIDLRHYLPLSSSLSLAARTAGTLVSGGVIPTYAHTYFGYRERIRGHFDEVLEGEDQVTGSLELRFAVFPARTFIVNELPVPTEFKVWRFGITLSTFVDAGAVWFRSDGLLLDDFRRGQGVGVNFLLPYSYVFRLEYAWNEQWQGQWIIDLRGSF